MDKQFTASEVRELAATIWPDLSGREEVAETLNAFADLLEAREKAVPVGMLRIGADASNQYGKTAAFHYADACMDLSLGDHEVFPHPAPSDAEKRDTMTPHELAKRIEHGEKWKLADESARCQSQDAERLAEALRTFPEDPNPFTYRRCYANARAALAAHSAQAQPPAAKVTDAMQELADKYHELLWAVARKFPGETRHETALRYIREAECQEAAFAAQENPNG